MWPSCRKVLVAPAKAPAALDGEEAPATISACPKGMIHSLATERIAQVCPLGKARTQHTKLGAAAPIGVAGKEGMSGLSPA